MRSRLARVGLCAVACTILCPVGRAADGGEQSLSRADARCIADNIDAYLDDPADPVVIYLDLCSSFASLKDVSGSIRADLPNLPSSPLAHPNQKPNSVTLSKAVLRCLKHAAATEGFPASDPLKITGVC